MYFEIIGDITQVQLIARGKGIRTIKKLRQAYGPGSWRKLKGRAKVKLAGGKEFQAEVHWYEAHGIGKRDIKIKKFIS